MTAVLQRRLHDADWLVTGGVARVLALLNTDGDEGRAVGGAVRNALMDLPVGEVDIATTATPDVVMSRAKAAHIKAIPTGIDHGTVTLIVDGKPFEVTTLREDVETYGRKAKVAFGRDWARDAQRRDFTINALSANAHGDVYDYTDGLDDIAQRRVRFIGEASKRIAEDYLRILRFFRIHAAYGAGPVDREGLMACIGGREGLAHLSAERIRAEMLKLLVAPGAAEALQEMGDAGLLLRLLGGVTYHAPLRRMISIENKIGFEPDPIRRLAALAVQVREDTLRVAARLRLSNAEAAALESMGHRWWRFASLDDFQARVRVYKLSPERFRNRVMMGWARSRGEDAYWRNLLSLPERWARPVFPVKAADFIARGLKPGPLLGRALAQAEQDWINADFPDDAGLLDAIASSAARSALMGER